MGGPGAALLTIRLRDGAELRVMADGVWIGEQYVALAAIQDARQVSPDPETVALRVAGTGMVEFQPASPGDGGLALEAIYRLRPNLRPPGFDPRELPTGFPVPPPQPIAARVAGPYTAALPQYGQLPPGYRVPPDPSPVQYPSLPSMPPATPSPAAPGGPLPYPARPAMPRSGPVEQAAWLASRGAVTPYPRTYGGLIGAIFQLFNRHFAKLALIALCIAVPPALANGAAQLVLLHALGIDPLSGSTSFASTSCQDLATCNPFAGLHPLTGSALMLDAALGGGALVVSWLLTGWQIAALTAGSRQAVLGQPLRVGASLAAGLRRLLPTLIAWGLTQVLTIVLFAPAVALYIYLFLSLFPSGAATANESAVASSAVGLSALLGCFAIVGAVIGLFFFGTRLGLAPYAAADGVGPLRALGRSWSLTRGGFWRVLGIWLTFAVLTGLPAYIGSQFAVSSAPLAYLVLLPLIQVVTAPLMVMTWVALLYDQRVRREGFAAITADTASREHPASPGAPE
jgi:hypothetical protein